MLSMTQFEEHMIDILAAEEEDVVAVRNYVEGHGSATLNLVQTEETDPLEKLPGVPQGACAEALRAIVDAGDGSVQHVHLRVHFRKFLHDGRQSSTLRKY